MHSHLFFQRTRAASFSVSQSERTVHRRPESHRSSIKGVRLGVILAPAPGEIPPIPFGVVGLHVASVPPTAGTKAGVDTAGCGRQIKNSGRIRPITEDPGAVNVDFGETALISEMVVTAGFWLEDGADCWGSCVDACRSF